MLMKRMWSRLRAEKRRGDLLCPLSSHLAPRLFFMHVLSISECLHTTKNTSITI